jgi:hypothetical protein
MYEVIYMKADFEPWWMFEGWEEEVLSRQTFFEECHARNFLEETLSELRVKYKNESMKKNCFFAFWSENEKLSCEACSDDLQIFHGIILLFEGKPLIDKVLAR